MGRWQCLFLHALLGQLVLTLGARIQRSSARAGVSAQDSPVRKIITLIQEMKAQVEKDATADEEAYKKFMCWCEENKNEKTTAVSTAEARVDQLGTRIDELTATQGGLRIDMAGLRVDIDEDQDTVSTATDLRTDEHEDFTDEERDMRETIQLLGQAISTLSKVQLLQEQGQPTEKENLEVNATLLQVHDLIQTRLPSFRDRMQRDLFEVFGAMPRRGAAFEQQPLDKPEENLTGNAAGAKSYNSRSGGILGILQQMKKQFIRDLAAIRGEDVSGEKSFQQLRGVKKGEINIASDQHGRKDSDLATAVDDTARTREDREAMLAAIAADQGFLGTIRETCANEEAEYQKRSAARTDEITALSETLAILLDDTARDLYSKTLGFVQTGSSSHRARERAVRSALQRIARVATKNKSWALASLTVKLQLDAFTKVKAAMDTMLVELKKQQKDEVAKKESCDKNIDAAEDSLKEGMELKEDLTEKKQSLSDKIATFTGEIQSMKDDVAAMESSLKQAGEERKAQNQIFQKSIADQRATINILQKAKARLAAYYSFSQQAPPPRPSKVGYEKHNTARGVMGMLEKIIQDAEIEEMALNEAEQKAEKDYAAFAKGAADSIEADRSTIAQREGALAEASAAKSETEEASMANAQDIDSLARLLQAHHSDCDYILQNFQKRQTARMEEMDAIKDAKSILSGSKFNS